MAVFKPHRAMRTALLLAALLLLTQTVSGKVTATIADTGSDDTTDTPSTPTDTVVIAAATPAPVATPAATAAPTVKATPAPVVTAAPTTAATTAPAVKVTPAPAVTAVPTTAPTIAATPAATIVDTPTPTRTTPTVVSTPVPTPTATPAAAQTALQAVVRVIGPNAWPFDSRKIALLVQALTQSMSTITAQNIAVLTSQQVFVTGRKLLQTDSAADITMEFNAGSTARVAQVANDLGAQIATGAVANNLSKLGVKVTSISLPSTKAVAATASYTCSSGSIGGICIGSTGSSLSLLAIILIVLAAVFVAGLVGCISFCCWYKRHRAAQEEAVVAAAKDKPKKAMTPTGPKPFWADSKTATFTPNAINATATPAAAPVYPAPPASAPPAESEVVPEPAIVSPRPRGSEREMGGKAKREALKLSFPEFGGNVKKPAVGKRTSP